MSAHVPNESIRCCGSRKSGPRARDRSGGREGGRHQHAPRVRGGRWAARGRDVRSVCAAVLNNGTVRATVKDVAARAGVSPKTVSNVIHGVVFVRPETRERVERALAELDYVPNLGARGLRNGRYGLIALALPDLSTRVLRRAGAPLRRGGARARLVACRSRRRPPSRGASATCCPGRGRTWSTGSCSTPSRSRTRPCPVVRGPLPPTVLIGEVVQDRADHVGVDSVRASRDVTEHLLATGRRRIAARRARPRSAVETAAARQRTEGYRSALAAAGVAHDPDLEIPVRHWTTEQAVEATRAHLARHAGARRVRLLHGLDGARGAERAVGARAAGAGRRRGGGVRRRRCRPVRGASADHGGLRPARPTR